MYFYIDKNKAKDGVLLVVAKSSKPIKNFREKLGNHLVEYSGEDVPYYISYDQETDLVREATLQEQLDRGLIEISPFDKIIDNQVVPKTREDLIKDGYITLETEKAKAETEKNKQFQALNIFDLRVSAGRIEATEEEKTEIDNWYKAWEGVADDYTDVAEPIEDSYPAMPLKIEKIYNEGGN